MSEADKVPAFLQFTFGRGEIDNKQIAEPTNKEIPS